MKGKAAKFTEGIKRVILIADDEIINRELLGAILGDDYEIIYAENGAQALEVIAEKGTALSLVLLDLMMPEMDGLEVLRRMKSAPEIPKLPVIVLTSEHDAEVECLSLGAIDFIQKPYPQPEIVQARVRRTIELSEDRDLILSTERDELTGLYNKEFFFRYATQYDQHSKDEAMDAIFIDVNHFHLINERYGKVFADKLLNKIAEKIRNTFTPLGGISGRLGGDVFIVYCPHLDDYDFISERASVDLTYEGKTLSYARVRVGVYSCVDKEIGIERRFDRAKQAANSIRGSFTTSFAVYDDELHRSELFSEQLVEDFSRAIEEKQFSVFYQPKFDVRSETPFLTSAEALVRWVHPKYGMISPGVFIPLFEENGLIRELDRYVWFTAADQVKKWRDEYGVSIPVSVNVSRIDMYDPELIDILCRVLTENDLSSDEILLEITESAYTNDTEQIINTVNKLRKIGFKIEMDDFGTGYSSLNMISKLPIDALKLDMSFIRTAFNEKHDTRMIEVIIGIADYLGVPVIAEGVETTEQLKALRAMGCDIVQGYYFSKPVPAAEYEKFIADRVEQSVSTDVDTGAMEIKTLINDPASRKAALMNVEQTLAGMYEGLYYVNTRTDYYVSFSPGSKFRDLQIRRSGADFFEDMLKELQDVVYDEDQSALVAALKKETLLSYLTGEKPFSTTYRLMIYGSPVYYNMKAVRATADNHHIIIAISCVDDIVTKVFEDEGVGEKNHELITISRALSNDFDGIYYVNIMNDKYTEYASRRSYDTLALGLSGTEFFKECIENIKHVVAPDDIEKVSDALEKNKLISSVRKSGTYYLDYHLIVNKDYVPYRLKATMSDDIHLVIGVTDISAEVMRDREFAEAHSKSVTFSSIARALAADYFGIYYIDSKTGDYTVFNVPDEFYSKGVKDTGKDFFGTCVNNISKIIHKDDADRVGKALTKHNLLRELDKNGTFTMRYRLFLGDKIVNASLKATRMEGDDGRFIVIGISSIDAQVKQEEELNEAKEAANKDALTGVKSKRAFVDTEAIYNEKISKHEELSFALVVCDLNSLKKVNDQLGHTAGDNYIKSASTAICDAFKHSPVFRIGGDEFVAILTGSDFENRSRLFEELTLKCGGDDYTKAVIVACGMADFDPSSDKSLKSVFERADSEMYANIVKLKEKEERKKDHE